MSSKKKSAPSQSPEPRKLQDATFELLWQRTTPLDGLVMSSRDIKSFSLTAGTRVIVSIGRVNLICTVWASSLSQAGTAILNKSLQPNFEAEGGSQKMKISSDFGGARLLPCASITVDVQVLLSHSVKEIVKAHLLAASFVFRDERIQIPHNGSYINIQISPTHSSNVLSPSSATDGSAISCFYLITKNTTISFHSATSSSIRSDSVIPPRVQTGYPSGYESELAACRKFLELGLRMSASPSSDLPGGIDNSLHSTLKQPPKGLLIHGAPGVGKTRFVRHLLGSDPFSSCAQISIGSEILLKKYAGELESDLSSRVVRAVQQAPSVLVLEEIDLLCPDRSNASDTQKRLVSCLLRLIDELRNHRVFIVATSSRPSGIEKAMRRPGRLDKEVELGVPSSGSREPILKQLCVERNIHVSPSDRDRDVGSDEVTAAALKEVAGICHGMVASDLVELLKEAVCSSSIRVPKSRQAGLDAASIDDLIRGMDELAVADQASPADESSGIVVSKDKLLAAAKKVSPSALREIVVEVPTVRWTDIGGMETVKASLREVVEWPLLHPELFRTMNISPPRGVLLYGPPGCSKTLMAKALATESSMNFLAVRGPELLSKWLGESEKAVQSLFRRARAVAPCIVFFDEIDAFATKRGDSSSSVNDRVLSQLLAELDGVGGLKQVVLVAATNRPDLLDPALLRPGRLDRKIFVSPPDEASREQIIRLSLGKLPLLFSLDERIASLVSGTEGFSGAEIVSACQEAVMLAVEDDAEGLSADYLLSSISNVAPQITDDMIAYYDKMIQMFE